MKTRFGGLLAMALGAVLIVNGVSSADGGTVGLAAPTGQCGELRLGALTTVDSCPVGTIVVTETTTGSVTPPPGGWQVTITSTCLDPSTNLPVDATLTVPNNDSATSDDLYIFTNFGATADSPKCQYALTEAPVAGVTATFTPAAPVQIAFDANSQAGRTVAVALANAATVAPSDSAPASQTVAPSDSAAPSETVEPSGSGPQTDFTDTAAGSASAGAGDAGASTTAAPIAETGPSQPITASLWLGIGLLFLGLFLLFEGRIRTLGKHRT